MKRSSKLTAEHLQRRAVIYVRQSTPGQVLGNLESQRRQYDLAELAREVGFEDVLTIDDDLGRSGSGKAQRPGFDRLVAELASREVGAVFCLEASRLARNGRDWHMLLDMCALSGAVIAGPEGVYDPRLGDDRLFLGLKGSFSEYELSIMRQRAQGAIQAKAERGELRIQLQVGLCWTRDGRIELNPDARVQDAIRLVYRKYEEMGTMRQTLLWFHAEGVVLPTGRYRQGEWHTEWALPGGHTIGRILSSPLYAGAYVWGRRTMRPNTNTAIVKPQEQWRVLIIDHHPGYVTWDDHLRFRKMMADNAFAVANGKRKAGRGGNGLLAGLLRCSRCGRRLNTTYTGENNPRYKCPGTVQQNGQTCAVAFSGVHPDDAISEEVLKAVEQPALEAATAAAEAAEQRHAGRLRAAELELQEARYRAQVAERRYDNVDPDNRLVAPELERRWNSALSEVDRLETRLAELQDRSNAEPRFDREQLQRLAVDLPRIWNDERADARTKQRIVRTLIQEIIVDVDTDAGRVLMTVHWMGGRHSKVEARRRRLGQHRLTTSVDTLEIMKKMGANWDDTVIAATLNRLGIKSAKGLTWTSSRVRGVRMQNGLTDAALKAEADKRPAVTLVEASRRLGTSTITVRNLIVTVHPGTAAAQGAASLTLG